jgi:hypothetical protein
MVGDGDPLQVSPTAARRGCRVLFCGLNERRFVRVQYAWRKCQTEIGLASLKAAHYVYVCCSRTVNGAPSSGKGFLRILTQAKHSRSSLSKKKKKKKHGALILSLMSTTPKCTWPALI